MDRKYDFIIYGASGYTAGYIIDAFGSEDARIALAVRNARHIRETRYPVYECSLEDIDRIAAQTRVLINCVGPYSYHGEAVVRSCIRNDTHYMDITGEVYFFELLISKYHDEAARKGLYILNCCGFDSVPADIGVMHLRSMFDCAEIESVLRVQNLVINETTWESLMTSVAKFKQTTALREKKYGHGKKRRAQRIASRTNSYEVIFRGSDYSVVKRSQALLKSVGLQDAKYAAYLDVGGWLGMVKYWGFVALIWVLSGFKLGRWLITTACSFFTFGLVKKNPSRQQVEKASFSIEMMARGEKDREIRNRRLVISGPDPSYITTAICLTQCAVGFLRSLDKMEPGTGVTLFRGGVITPACVLYNTDIVQRLISKGIKFEMKEE